MGIESGPDSLKDFLSLLDAFKSEDLYSLFSDKEKIEADIADIKGSNIKENRKNLLNELGLEREKLFKSFYDYYGDYDEHVKYLGDFLKSQGNSGQTYGEKGVTLYDLVMDADKILHEKLYRIIFDTTGKDEIKDVLSGKDLEVDKVLSRVSAMVKYFFEVRKDEIKDILERCIQDSPYFTQLMDNSNCTYEDYINKFIDYYETDTLNYIFGELEHVKISKDYDSVDLEGRFGYLVTSIDLSLLAKFTNTLVFKGFLEFCSDKNGNIGNSDEISEYRSMDYVYGKACGLFDEIFPNSKRKDILDGLDFLKLADGSLKKSLDAFGRILQNLKIHDTGARFLFSSSSVTEKLEYVEGLFLKHKTRIFPQLKEYFCAEVSKLLFIGENFKLSIDLDNITSILREKYDKAKPHVGVVSKKQSDEMEKTFLKNEKDKFRTKFYDAFSKFSDFFEALELKEFFIFIEIFSQLLSDAQVPYKEEFLTFKEKLDKDYYNFVYTTLEEKFKKSHDNAVKPKQSVSPIVKKTKESEVVESKQSTSVVIERKSLPNEEVLFNRLKKYFGLGEGGNLDRALVRSLRNSGLKYKKKWFDRFAVDEEFFKILREYGFECDDEINDSIDDGHETNETNNDGSSVSESCGTGTEPEESDVNKQLLNNQLSLIKEKIGEKKSLDDELISLYIKFFNDLGYEILIENNIKDGLQEIWSRVNQLNSLLLKLINGGRIKKDPIFGGIKSNVFSRNFKTAYVLGFDHTRGKFIVAEEGGKKYLLAITKHGGRYDDKFS